MLPYSHKEEKLPSREFIEKHEFPVEAPAGSVIVFDAMLFHRAGSNTSKNTRRAVNNVYSIPLLKQQLNLSAALEEQRITDPELRRLLDLDGSVPSSALEFRNRRLQV